MNGSDDHKNNFDSERRQNHSTDEEYAAEFAANDYQAKDDHNVISMYGWIGLALSVISFFMWPVVLGGAGIVLGFVSRNKGANMLGNFAITIGVISILLSLFTIPF